MAMNNHKRRSVTRILTPVALAVILTACSTAGHLSKQTLISPFLQINQRELTLCGLTAVKAIFKMTG